MRAVGSRVPLRPLLLVVLLLGHGSAQPSPPPPEPRLADELRRLYQAPATPAERWRGTPRLVTLADGRRLPREQAYRDHPGFVAAALELLRSGEADDAPFAAWLLATLEPPRSAEAERGLLAALRHADPRAAYEAAHGLGERGTPAAAPALRELLRRSDPILRAAALGALDRIAQRSGDAALLPATRDLFAGRPFQRGIAWWRREGVRDLGADTFPRLRALGVDSVAIHTFDPLQRGLHDPELAPSPRPLVIDGLGEIVAAAHAAGLRVMVKPHLEMRGYEPTPEERAILRQGDAAERERLFARIRSRRRPAPEEWHNNIEMKSEQDWRRWFAGYEGYLLGYARQAQQAGADLLCVGRELDRSVLLRERDWRALIAKARGVFKGPLVYSANFDSYEQLGFWDALDYVGVSAYFPLADAADPSNAQLAAGWQDALGPLERLSRRVGRPVLLSELGYPAAPGAARTPWRPLPGPADVRLQARCYEAGLQAIARRGFVHGVYAWLWEGTRQPPFRDASFSVQGKPAASVIGGYYRGLSDAGAP